METIGGDLANMPFTPLDESQVEILRAAGRERRFAAGELVSAAGSRQDRLWFVEDGEIEVVDDSTGERLFPTTLGPRQFTGDVALLSGGGGTLSLRAAKPTRTIEVEREALLAAMSANPELGDHLLTIFSARRRRQFEGGESAVVLIGPEADQAVREVEIFLSRNRLPFQSHPLRSPEADEAAAECKIAAHEPAVVFTSGERITDPTPLKVAQRLGLDLDLDTSRPVDLLIVGGGPAGVAAAVYAGAEGLAALLIEDVSIGGQAGTSSRIENYMGFPTGISGGDLVWRGQVQALKFGTRFAMPRRVTKLDDRGQGVLCATIDGEIELCARAVLIAAGVQYRRLPIEGIERLEGAGVYYAATEMEARFCRESEAVIVGGGNSAGQAAMYLSRTANHVHLLVRGASLAESMSDYLRRRLEQDARITIHYRSECTALHGDKQLEAVTIRSGDEERRVPTKALFVMAGAAANTCWLSNLVALDAKGFVLTGEEASGETTYATSHPRIWAVGDVRSGSVKRVASAVGEGSVVVSAIWSALEQDRENERRQADQQPAAELTSAATTV